MWPKPELSVRERFLPFHIPMIGEEEIAAVVSVLRSDWLTTGPKVRAFERQFAEFVGARHAVAVNSGTAALHLALETLGVDEGDEVIVPTMTFAATAEVVLYRRAVPVLVDSGEAMNIDAERLEAAITPRTKAVIPVHFGGRPCNMESILSVAADRGVAVIEDAAHALPARYHGRMIGSLGDITCFSFYATKTITTGEGGMATTENSQWADRMRMLSLHGISRDAWKRYTAEGSWRYEILSPGYKYNMTDIAAGLGIEQLKKCDAFLAARRRIADQYAAGFSDLPEIIVPTASADLQHAWHLYVIQLRLERLRIDRDGFLDALKQANIGASVHFIPLHLHPYYREKFDYREEDFPRASAAFRRIVSLPIYPKMTSQDVEDVIEAVRDIVDQHRY